MKPLQSFLKENTATTDQKRCYWVPLSVTARCWAGVLQILSVPSEA